MRQDAAFSFSFNLLSVPQYSLMLTIHGSFVCEAFFCLTCPGYFYTEWSKSNFHLFSFPVCCTCLLEAEREIWHSTGLKDPFCTASVCLPLHTECMLGGLLSWRFLETWLDAPASPQVSCYFAHCRFCSWKYAYSGWCVKPDMKACLS